MDDQNPNSSLIPPNESSKTLAAAITKWLGIFSQNHRIDISPDVAEIWLTAFGHMTSKDFEKACVRHLQTSKFFPCVADIFIALAPPPVEVKETSEAEAENAWIHCLRYANRWNPDTDPPRGVSLTKSESRSLQVAGGIYMLWTLQDDGGTELAFMRKAFVESFKLRDRVQDLMIAEVPRRQVGDGRPLSIKEIISGTEK